ncbi:MAG: phenylalanine--tRNA ligase subunit beta [Candidatus Hydrogenedentes bacterium]|nr:phenylalanine--tRNA ligase subunit beta [Candidatus Hydrogenedentota bacterium]
MRISYRWLKELVDFDLSPDDLAHRLTMLGLEIESVERPGLGVSGIRIGKILDIKPHPDADKLVVCQTDVGQRDPLQIVCGAKNMNVGDRVPTAVVGATLPGDFTIGRRKMRGVESQGMMCSARELGLGQDHAGLLILSQDFPIGEDAVPLLGLDDVILEIEVTPNRGDWAGMIGVAREVAAALGTSLHLPDSSLTEADDLASSVASVTIEDPTLCPRYIGRVMKGVTVGPSPLWMVQRLVHAGQRAISSIVDITNYILLETGHPLHAFDLQKLLKNRIIVRTAKHGETIETIDGQSRSLDEKMLVIADAEHPVAVAGVMGGLKSEVGDSTTEILLESAVFQPQSVRRTSRILGLQTEASARFQRGADPEMAAFAMERATKLIQEIAGAQVLRGQLDEFPGMRPPLELTLRYKRTGVLLGAEVPPATQRDILTKLQFDVRERSPESCTAGVPSWRHDVSMEADLIEEIARLHGFDNIPSRLPMVRKTEVVLAPRETEVRELRRLLSGLGLTEMMNLSFGNPSDLEKAGMGENLKGMVMLQNPLSENHAGMRVSLIPGVLAVLASNLRRGVSDIHAFEVGNIYTKTENNELPTQHLRLCLVFTGSRADAHWGVEGAKVDFFDAKGFAEALFVSCGIEASLMSFAASGPLKPRHSAQFSCDDTVLGYVGSVSEEVLGRFDIDQPVYLVDIDLDAMLNLPRSKRHFTALSVYPPSLRDMAVVVDAAVPAEQVLQIARDAGGDLLRQVSVFDVYSGKQVPEGKKSLALGLTFQATDRTLTDKDTQKTWDRILKNLRDTLQAELR